MDLKRRNYLVYGLLVAAWVLILFWQMADHTRVENQARAELRHRARDVSTTVGTTLRVLRRFGNVVSKDRVEGTLSELLRPGEWEGIALLNETNEIVASVGTPVSPLLAPALKAGSLPAELWGRDSVILFNPVALGTNVMRDLEPTNHPVVVNFRRPGETNRPPGSLGPPGPTGSRSETNDPGDRARNDPRRDQDRLRDPDRPREQDRSRGPGRNRSFTRPPWWTEEEWKAILEKQGVHTFAVVMSTKNLQESSHRDLWLRTTIVFLAAVSALGSGLAWRNLTKSSDLQLRLVRTSELNTHLKQMNLAAAGLAHETRNPLNIIRGMAQMISKQASAPGEIREKSRAIVDESDKVTAQLNEFINYSRPREVRPTPLALHAVANEVVRALAYDIEEKKIRVEIKGERLTIEADEQLLRQVLFNLVLNATQAVGENGEIQILAQRRNASEASLEVSDNGPGVPPERRTEIFKPYFTTQAKGTGLGLAIVRQNVLAHGWEIECLSNQPKGALFRITHLKLAKP